MGSVKDLKIIKEPTEDKMGVGQFVFSDRYSVFDWGEMPDKIPRKGEALCIQGAYFFEKLENQGIQTHYRGVVNQKTGKVVQLEELEEPTNIMEIQVVRIVKPEYRDGKYDYSEVQREMENGNILIPLEVIYRNTLPPGSSVFRRLEKGEITPEDLGLDHYPEPGEKLEKPIVDVSTKYEKQDRYISWKEAKEITDLRDEEIKKIKELTMKANDIITKEVGQIGLSNEDGKFEFALSPANDIIFVDVSGTMDECRFSYNGIPVSKEILRKYYRKTKWYQHVVNAKDIAKKLGIGDWKICCSGWPRKAPKELISVVSRLYQAFTNELTSKEFFKVDSLDEVVKDYEKLLKKIEKK